MRIFLGLNNVASMFIDLKEAFKVLGVDTFIVNKGVTNQIINHYSDFTIEKAKNRVTYFKPRRISTHVKSWWNRNVDKYVLKKAIKECDVFIFFWDTIMYDYSDLAEIKKAGKIIIPVFVGDDVRWYHSMKQEFVSYQMHPIEYEAEYDTSIVGLERRLRYLRNAEKYADFIFSRLDQAQLQLRPYYRWNMMVPCKKIIEQTNQRKIKPIVAHAPSHRNVKGTQYVLAAFERLKKEGVDFEPLLIENVSNPEAIKMYANADILIDQLLCPGAGKLATEGLASGTIVMGHMAYDRYPQKNPNDCPIIDVNPDTLYEKLKELILNYDFRKEHAKKGRPYSEKHLEVNIFCKKVLALINNEKIEFDYTPNFYRDTFIPESAEAKKVYNKWNNYVSDCDWYKKSIVPEERAGLLF